MTYEASTFLYAIAVAIFALGGMVGGFTGGWIANKCGRFVLRRIPPKYDVCNFYFQYGVAVRFTENRLFFMEYTKIC